MAMLTLFDTRSNSSLDTYSEQSLRFEKGIKPSTMSFLSSKLVTSSTPPKKPSPLARAARHLRNVLVAVKSFGSTHWSCSKHTASPDLRRISKPYPIPHYDEKLFQSTAGAEFDKSSLLDGSISMRTAMEAFGEARSDLRTSHDPSSASSPDGTYTAAPSSNWAYKPCSLFDDESLQFLNAFIPNMEPVAIWGLPSTTEALSSKATRSSPSISWMRRNTRIWPGHIIEVPSAHDKGGSYLLSCENEQATWPNVEGLMTESNQCPKLFVAQCGDVASLHGYPRAFIMCKPPSEN
ncbi:hypothetical protein CTheo_7315 [Ceratobasidium theobromae]|uniref:Uncharacterized protein n=1 Tax=Ceratobasidium theobromae TaxID=1582974 RepID=A0A5N5QD38_9AGAM|nr:hypothetical protein CTheo_7315 [Ceratobasidium theobromae]